MIKKILFNDKVNVKPKAIHEEELWAEDINHIKEVVNSNSEELEKGFQTTAPIQLIAGETYEFIVPLKAMLFALDINGPAKIKIGKTPGGDEITDIDTTEPAVLQFGFLKVTNVFFQSDKTVTVEPIIYKK